MASQKPEVWITVVSSVPSSNGNRRSVQKGWSPQADLYEGADHLLIRVDLAGVSTRQITVQFDLNRPALIVTGVRSADLPAGLVPHQIEIEDGPFERVIGLPTADLDVEATESRWTSGILILVVPKTLTGRKGFVVESLTSRRKS